MIGYKRDFFPVIHLVLQLQSLGVTRSKIWRPILHPKQLANEVKTDQTITEARLGTQVKQLC